MSNMSECLTSDNPQVSELVKLSGGQIDEQLKDQFEDITQTILSNQTEALANLTRKVGEMIALTLLG